VTPAFVPKRGLAGSGQAGLGVGTLIAVRWHKLLPRWLAPCPMCSGLLVIGFHASGRVCSVENAARMGLCLTAHWSTAGVAKKEWQEPGLSGHEVWRTALLVMVSRFFLSRWASMAISFTGALLTDAASRPERSHGHVNRVQPLKLRAAVYQLLDFKPLMVKGPPCLSSESPPGGETAASNAKACPSVALEKAP